MEIEILYTKTDKIFSTAIRVVTKILTKRKYSDIPSHVAILKDGLVYEADAIEGMRIAPYTGWNKTKDIIHRRKRNCPCSEMEFEAILNDLWNKGYDWYGVFYFLIAIMMKMATGKMPIENKWQKPNRYSCNEIIGKVFRRNLSMKSPIQILEMDLENKL